MLKAETKLKLGKADTMGERLRILLEETDSTAAELSRGASIDEASISNYLRSISQPRDATLVRIVLYFASLLQEEPSTLSKYLLNGMEVSLDVKVNSNFYILVDTNKLINAIIKIKGITKGEWLEELIELDREKNHDQYEKAQELLELEAKIAKLT